MIAWILSAGPASKSASAQRVSVQPGDNLQSLVNAHPPGTRFEISPGIYRMQSIKPKNGDSFAGEPGAVLSGAALLTAFSRQGQYWVAEVSVKSRGSVRGECAQEHPACMLPEDLFIDDAPLERVSDLSGVAPGKWYLDYDAGKAYLADDPSNHKVEISLIPYAFYGTAGNVTIQGLAIEKYAGVAGDGAIEAPPAGQDWVIENNQIRLNHGMGIRVNSGMHVLNNKIYRNGQMGLGGGGNEIIVDGNEIAYNNYAGYSYGWEAGGTKFTRTRDLIVRNNNVHDNNGPGLWTDIENNNVLYEGNRTRANKEAGILHEISYHAVIRNNTVENDGFAAPGKTSPWYGGGIVITASEDVEVYGNTVKDCMNGIVGLQPNRTSPSNRAYLLRNLYVHDNVIVQSAGIAAGIVKSPGLDDSIFTAWRNRFVNNTYHLGSGNGKYFEWMNVPETHAEWQARGHGE